MSSRNILFPLLVLVIVLIIWFSQNLFRTHRTEVPVSLRFVNLSDEYLVTEIVPHQIKLTVEGKGLEILKFRRSDYYLEIDATPLNIGYNDVTLTDRNLIFEEPHFRGILSFYFNQKISVVLNRSVTAQIPVSLRYLSDADETFFRQRNASPQPNRVEIVGPSNVVSKLLTINTLPLASHDVKDTEPFKAELDIPEGIVGIKPDIVTIVLESPSVIMRTIPLITIQYPKERLSMIIPQSVTIIIEGEAERLQTIRPQMITASINVPEDEAEDFASIKFLLPEDIRLVDYTPQKVQIFRHE
ncbi:MAG: YbbR-like domain-containing protein [Candidatus Cloacimonetes bacterium]|nr:YbbR-like domain-containing protein [Candidatus Cloacimonadota bacterium]